MLSERAGDDPAAQTLARWLVREARGDAAAG